MVSRINKERAQLHPTHAHFFLGLVEESTSVRTRVGKAEEGELNRTNHRLFHVTPNGGVVSQPMADCSLGAGKRAAGYHNTAMTLKKAFYTKMKIDLKKCLPVTFSHASSVGWPSE